VRGLVARPGKSPFAAPSATGNGRRSFCHHRNTATRKSGGERQKFFSRMRTLVGLGPRPSPRGGPALPIREMVSPGARGRSPRAVRAQAPPPRPDHPWSFPETARPPLRTIPRSRNRAVGPLADLAQFLFPGGPRRAITSREGAPAPRRTAPRLPWVNGMCFGASLRVPVCERARNRPNEQETVFFGPTNREGQAASTACPSVVSPRCPGERGPPSRAETGCPARPGPVPPGLQ